MHFNDILIYRIYFISLSYVPKSSNLYFIYRRQYYKVFVLLKDTIYCITAITLEVFLNTVTGLQSFKICTIYLILVPTLATLTRGMQGLSMRRLLLFHNFCCSFLSIYTAASSFYGIYQQKSIFSLKPVDSLRSSFYFYWLSKNIELLDTLFIILRRKTRQLSFLHVYHHSSMVVFSEFAYRYCPYPAIAMPLGINSVVHIFLYYYYGMCSFDPKNPPRWKKRLTQLQIVQFIIGLMHTLFGYLYYGFCIYGNIYGLTMLWLFSSFYYNSFIAKKGAKRE